MNWGEAVASGVVVVVGVVTAHWLEQRAAFMRQIREDALELSHLMSQLSGGYLDPRHDTSMGSPWWELRQRVYELLGRLRVSVRGRKMRRGDEIRTALDRLSVTVGAADHLLLFEGKQMPKAATLDFVSDDLTRALWPKAQKSLYAEMQAVQARWAEGMPSYFPKDPPAEPQRRRWWRLKKRQGRA